MLGAWNGRVSPYMEGVSTTTDSNQCKKNQTHFHRARFTMMNVGLLNVSLLLEFLSECDSDDAMETRHNGREYIPFAHGTYFCYCLQSKA